MNKKKETIYFLIILVAGLLSFVNARVTSLSKVNQVNTISQPWLTDEPLSIAESEEKFNEEVSLLVSKLKETQTNLMDALENSQTPNEVILEHVDYVNEAHQNLILKVGEHIVGLRNNIGQANREELMKLCAQAISAPLQRLAQEITSKAEEVIGTANKIEASEVPAWDTINNSDSGTD